MNAGNRWQRFGVAACLLLGLAGCDQHGRYQIATAQGASAQEDRVWVLDTSSGRVSLCYETAARIRCLPQSGTPAHQGAPDKAPGD